jgi:hypothetical protein
MLIILQPFCTDRVMSAPLFLSIYQGTGSDLHAQPNTVQLRPASQKDTDCDGLAHWLTTAERHLPATAFYRPPVRRKTLLPGYAGNDCYCIAYACLSLKVHCLGGLPFNDLLDRIYQIAVAA